MRREYLLFTITSNLLIKPKHFFVKNYIRANNYVFNPKAIIFESN